MREDAEQQIEGRWPCSREKARVPDLGGQTNTDLHHHGAAHQTACIAPASPWYDGQQQRLSQDATEQDAALGLALWRARW